MPEETVQRLDADTALVDLRFQGRPQVIGSYALLGDPPALIETGPASCVPALEAGLAALGLRLEDLGEIAVTHIHLDHAGAAGVLARQNPRLRVYVHEHGARHLADPSRLVRSAERIYGEAMATLWGEVAPVPADRIVALRDGDTFTLAGHPIRALHAPGHANHHHVFAREGVLFTGDAAGVALPGCAYVRPPTPPPELDLEAWDRTLARMLREEPRRLYVAHYGAREEPAEVLEQLRQRLRAYADALRPGWEAGEDEERLLARLRDHVQPELEAACGPEVAARYELGASFRMNVQGFVRYFTARAGGSTPAAT